jgi:hypothetical protein
VPILYSLGNFVFWQEPEIYYRKTGFMAELGLRGGHVVGLRLTPYLITPGGLRLMPADELPSFFDAVRRASEPLADDEDVRAAWEAFIDRMGQEGLAHEAQWVMDLYADEPANGVAKARNLFVTPAHRNLWIDATTRFIEGRMGTAPEWARDLVEEWMARPLSPGHGQSG